MSTWRMTSRTLATVLGGNFLSTCMYLVCSLVMRLVTNTASITANQSSGARGPESGELQSLNGIYSVGGSSGGGGGLRGALLVQLDLKVGQLLLQRL